MPWPPFVEPPAVSRSRAATIRDFSRPGVEGSTMPAAPAYTTIATRSFSPSSSTSSFSPRFTSGSRLGGFIEPETSIRNTRLLSGRCPRSISRPLMPTRTRECLVCHGHWATSTCAAKGCSSPRRRIVVSEIVQQLFDADRVGRRQRAVLQEIHPRFGIRGRIDVDRERRERRVGHSLKGVLCEVGVLVAAVPGPWPSSGRVTPGREGLGAGSGGHLSKGRTSLRAACGPAAMKRSTGVPPGMVL